MDDRDKDGGYYLGWYCAFGLACVLFFSAVWFNQFESACTESGPSWLPWTQPEEHCLREWMAALSGWVGFTAAAIGTWFVFGQLKEQRRQTAFMLGDGKPTMEVYRSSGRKTSGILRVVNWNRRTTVIDRVHLHSTAEIPRPKTFVVTSADPEEDSRDDMSVEVDVDGVLFDRVRIAGSINRQGTPNHIDIQFEFDNVVDPEVLEVERKVEVEIELRFFHPEHPRIDDQVRLVCPARMLFPKPDSTFN
ncbi:hypothetical protein IB238_09160 [Rhizobium sp. ARZ01]|uniref:hypothetical protein n=1 Tax=Rhizobium sp. ARZ01 TaxID=2769313 RepID=UPI00177D5623|nr:hypothetical protein [Rhizobium sp. ARZ01]MBD9372787.1 hypothetical protein [Rhizobium sp. ARZ01]